MKLRLFGLIASVLMLTVVLFSSANSADARGRHIWHIPGTNPVIFVHGGSGSAMQFESQAMRFEQNFYPHEYVNVLEFDSSLQLETLEDIWNRMDQLIADIEDETGADQVVLMGHSMGGQVTLDYINSSPERAAKVARYVTFDSGYSCDNPSPDGIPTLSLWGDHGFHVGCEMAGATNVVIENAGHVQTASSADSFFETYKFLTGFRPPLTKYILPQLLGRIELAGRAVIYGKNIGVEDASVEIWRVNRDTGARIRSRPDAVYVLDETGDWGPFRARRGQAYEFNIVREGESDHPFYQEPFIRSDYLIRLNTSPEPDGGTSKYMDRSPNHVNLVVGRNMELWGDQAVNDALEINGVDVISPGTNYQSKSVNFMFIWDKYADGVSNLGVPQMPYHMGGFFTGVDYFMPGASPADGTTSLVLTSRLSDGKTQTINVPNRASSETRRISVTFNDWAPLW